MLNFKETKQPNNPTPRKPGFRGKGNIQARRNARSDWNKGKGMFSLNLINPLYVLVIMIKFTLQVQNAIRLPLDLLKILKNPSNSRLLKGLLKEF